MKFHPQLITATLQKRYKRFLADVILTDKSQITAHCPNPGAMLGLKATGSKVWLSLSDNPKRKLPYTFELIEVEKKNKTKTLVGVNTNRANSIAREAIEAGLIKSIPKHATITPEQRYGENSRIDFLITAPNTPPIYLEVKSVTLMREEVYSNRVSDGLYEFPDSVTTRGTKHLHELVKMVEAGNRAIMLFLIQRNDGKVFSIASDIDPQYYESFKKAVKAGVEVYCVQCDVTPKGIFPNKLVDLA